LGEYFLTTKHVTFDFFSIDSSDYDKFNIALEKDKSKYVKRWIKYKNQFVRLEQWDYKDVDDLYVGYCSKLKIDEVDLKGSLTDIELGDLGLTDDEGIAKVTSFAIIPSHRTLILQRTHDGVRAGSFLHLLCNVTRINDLELSVMIDQDALKKLKKMNKITSFVFKVANPTMYENYKDTTLKEASALSQHYQSRFVKIDMGMGRGDRDTTMSIEHVKQSARNLLRLKSENDFSVQSIMIKGKETDDDSLMPLDLINRKLIHKETLELKNRIIPPDDLITAAWKAYNEKKEEVINYSPL
jgi:hypothetical protein